MHQTRLSKQTGQYDQQHQDMAPMTELLLEPTLPKLLALDKRHNDFDDKIKEATLIAGILLQPTEIINKIGAVKSAPSRTRSEFVLRWTVDKFKTADGREACRNSKLVWPLLQELIRVVPTSLVARLLQASGFLKNVGSFLEECAAAFTLLRSESQDGSNAVQMNGTKKQSKKRKRGEKEPSPPSSKRSIESSATIEQAVLGITSLLQSIIALSEGELVATDAASREHVDSALRTNAAEAARILDAWLRCLMYTFKEGSTAISSLDAHRSVLHIWARRSREQNDETGASPKIFSDICLVSATALLGELPKDVESSDIQREIKSSLEQLLAKHALVPAHTFFDASLSSRHPDLQRARSALVEYFEPLRLAILAQKNNRLKHLDTAKTLTTILPELFDLAVRLSPSTTPAQQTAQVAWLESVFAVLSACASEPLPHQDGTDAQDASLSPLVSMLQVLKARDLSLSDQFLESILVGYSGLKNLRKSSYPLRLDIVAGVLDFNGGIFLKHASTTEPGITTAQASQPHFVEALIASMSEISWSNHDDHNFGTQSTHGSQTTDYAVEHLLIPLLRAYSVARRLPSFISLWFWEVRRQWKKIGSSEEAQLPWLSQRLLHIFRDQLETSLTTTRISELLIEYILPIRQLADEVLRTSTEKPKWSDLPAIAPACASIVMLEALLQSIEREETFQQNQAAWKALKDLPRQLALLDLDGLPAASRVWSILARVYKLSYWTDGKETFLALQKVLLEGDKVFQTAVDQASDVTLKGTHDQSLAFVMTVCGYALDITLIEPARSALNSAAKGFPLTLKEPKRAMSNGTLARLRHIASLFVQYSSAMPLLAKETRQEFFSAVLSAAAQTRTLEFRDILDALIAAQVDKGKVCLDDLLTVLSNSITGVSSETQEQLAFECVLTISPNLIPRPKREQIIDNIRCLQQSDEQSMISIEHIAKAVALLLRLLSYPDPTAQLCINPKNAFTLASVLDSVIVRHENQTQSILDLLQSSNGLFKSLMRQALNDATEERRATYHQEFLSAIKLDESISLRPVTAVLVKSFLVATGHLHAKSTDFSTVRARFFGLLVPSSSSDAHSTAWRWVILNSVVDTLPTAPGEQESFGLELAERVLAETDWATQDSAPSAAITLKSFFETKATIDPFVAKLKEDLAAQDYCQVLGTFEQQIKTTRARNKLAMAVDLMANGSIHHLQLLHVVLKHFSLEDASSLDSGKQFLVQLCELINTATEVGKFGAATSCINTILRTKSFLITQHGIDTLLTTLSTISSAQAPALPMENAGFVFDRLCQLTTSTIHLHRRKLGGRMHLLVSLIQNLMSCLFTPHRYQVSSLSARPAWLSSLTTEHAVAYTRVLTTLCSPTVSSTFSHRGFRTADANLVDETKKAKEYAGQYVSYVLLHYCTLQLQGSVTPEVGEKLKMGLWVMMEVVNIEAMRGMNAGMRREERVVWGALYAEWNRMGRFKLT